MNLFKTLLVLLVIYAFLNCQNKRRINNKIKLTQIGNIVFRRSYAGHLNWSDKKLDSVKKENPEFDVLLLDSLKDLIPNLEKVGLIQNGKLQLQKYYSGIEDTINLVINGGNEAVIYKKYNEKLNSYTLQVLSENEISEVVLNSTGHNINLSQLDIFDDTYKEIFILNSFYFMNGDMYNLTIYKVE